ncbi:hypothetical protein IBL99_002948 [Listeria monocytogenes]|nr:hypothetical protein [Listeria monocytogenes]EGE9351498.1 hypothetical protein [Listeria monocytogenes]
MEYIEFFNHVCQEKVLKDYVLTKIESTSQKVKLNSEFIIPNDVVAYMNDSFFLRERHFKSKVYYDLLEGENYVFSTSFDSKVSLIALEDTEYITFDKKDLFTLLEGNGTLSCLHLANIKKIQEKISLYLEMETKESAAKLDLLINKLCKEKKNVSIPADMLSIQSVARIVTKHLEF